MHETPAALQPKYVKKCIVIPGNPGSEVRGSATEIQEFHKARMACAPLDPAIESGTTFHQHDEKALYLFDELKFRDFNKSWEISLSRKCSRRSDEISDSFLLRSS